MFRANLSQLALSSALLVLGLGCGSADEASSSLGGSAGSPQLTPSGRVRCQAPPGISGSPQTINEAVQLLNALPKPTSVACFLESLDRPLSVIATNSVFSAQPAHSTRSPRLFIRSQQLLLSVVMDGDSSHLIEFGLLIDEERRSIKGELELPLAAPVGPNAPYDRVALEQGSVCGICHFSEEPVEGFPFGTPYSSVAFRPRADSLVPLDGLFQEFASCDAAVEPHRCEMLAAVFGGGMVQPAALPESMPTFF